MQCCTERCVLVYRRNRTEQNRTQTNKTALFLQFHDPTATFTRRFQEFYNCQHHIILFIVCKVFLNSNFTFQACYTFYNTRIMQLVIVEISHLKHICEIHAPRIFVIRPDEGLSFLVETCSLVIPEYHVVFTDGNSHLY